MQAGNLSSTRPRVQGLAKRAARGALSRFGLEIHRAKNLHADMEAGLAHLRARGLQPATVFDVGVGHGTVALYETFPEATHVLVEPLSEFAPEIARIQSRFRTIYVAAAAGERAGILNIYVKGHAEGSSAFPEQAGGRVLGTLRQVEVVTLDQLVAQHELKGPFLLKLDVEGAELQVLAGAQKTLREAAAVILEVTFLPKLKGAPGFAEVFRRMDELGFAVYDLFDLLMRPTDSALFQANAAFVPRESPLRSQDEWWLDAAGKLLTNPAPA